MPEANTSPTNDEVVVLKFGSSVLRTRADLPNAVHEIYRCYRKGYRVIAVVSAIGLTTDELLCEARELAGTSTGTCSGIGPEPYATAELLATGERACAASLGIALDRSGVKARVLNPREIGLMAGGAPLDSELLSVDVGRTREFLTDYPVLIVPGFFATDAGGRTHLLGRGGSDLTAVFLTRHLNASRCRLLKDVDGVYECDPASNPSASPRRFMSLDYATALKVATPLIQPKAVEFLRLHRGTVQIAALAQGHETVVHAAQSAQLDEARPTEPSKVLILGLGTVGFGVYERLIANPEAFKVVGALIQDRGKYERLGVPGGLLRTRVDQVLKLRPDLVVDALPGTDPSFALVRHFIAAGVPVVSAGKALIAESGVALTALSSRKETTLRYSAAVGGSAPMIEAVERCAAAGPIASIAAVLNGTCNFVLDRCARGNTLDEAVTEAQRLGFAEADADEDLSGRDAARKLRILCRHAFGTDPSELRIARLDDHAPDRARKARRTGRVLRQVSRASRFEGEVHASVAFEEVPECSPFGRLTGEWNSLQISTKAGGLHSVSGRGAGHWATAEAVMADLFDLRRHLCGCATGQGVRFPSESALPL